MRIFKDERKPIEEETMFGLAKFEPIDEEELKRKYLQEVNNQDFEQQTEEEISIEDDYEEAMSWLEFLELEPDDLDVELNEEGDPLTSVTTFFATKYENDGEYNTVNSEYADRIKKINQEAGIGQFSLDEKIEDDDPLLMKQYEKECERMDKQLAMKRQRRQFTDTFIKDEDPDVINDGGEFTFEKKKASPYRSSNGFGFGGFTKNKDKTKAAASFTVEEDGNIKKDKTYDPEAMERRAKIYHAGFDMMYDMAYHGEKKQRAPKKKSYGKKKWSIRGMWSSAKQWMNSREAKVMGKIGTVFCMQLSMAMMNKQVEFDGAMQTVLFMGMMMGTLWIGRDLRAEGIDIRRMRFI